MTASYPELGSVLAGRYKLLRVIGEGGMGIVYEALHTMTEKRVAVKWLHASIAAHPEARQRLVREALATCRVSHPNVVEVYDVVQDDDTVFLVMELLHGERLEDALDRGDLSLPQLITLLLPAMQGVAEAHRHGVVHRDIHPANIFLARRGSGDRAIPKVLDFGISKLGGDETPALTRVGTTLGTPCYMSYEQLCNARDVDARTDVYSFAVILYRAATGRPPFEADSFTQLAIKIGTATPVPPKELRRDLPTSLERLILWAMARERDERVDSMDTFIRELEPYASEHAYRALMSELDRPVPEAVAKRAASSLPAPEEPEEITGPGRGRMLRGVAAVLMLLMVGLLVVSWWGQRDESAQPSRPPTRASRAPEPALPPLPMVLPTAASLADPWEDADSADTQVPIGALMPDGAHGTSDTHVPAPALLPPDPVPAPGPPARALRDRARVTARVLPAPGELTSPAPASGRGYRAGVLHRDHMKAEVPPRTQAQQQQQQQQQQQ